MLKLYVEDVRLVLAPNSELEMVITNSFFRGKADKKDFSYNFSFLATPEIRAKFGHAHLREVVITRKKYPIQAIIGNRGVVGVLNLTGFEDDLYDGHIVLKPFNIESYTKNLNELDNPLFQSSQALIDAWEKTWPETPYYLPTLIDEAFYDDLDTDFSNKYRPDYLGIINAGPTNYIDSNGRAKNLYTRVPQPCLLEVLRMGFADAGYKMAGSFVDDERIRKLWMFNNRCLDIIPEKDPDWLVTAESTVPYNYSLVEPTDRITFHKSSSALFDHNILMQYQLTWGGPTRIKIEVSYRNVTPGFAIVNLRLRIQWGHVLSWIEGSPTNENSGILSFEITPVVQANDIGHTVYFSMEDSNENATLEITSAKAEIEVLNPNWFDVASMQSGAGSSYTYTIDDQFQSAPLHFPVTKLAFGTFNAAKNSYKPGFFGLLHIRISVNYQTLQGASNNPSLIARRNGVFVASEPAGGASPNSVILEFTTGGFPVFSEFVFTLEGSGDPWLVDITDIRLQADYVDGPNKWINWKLPDNLKNYLPEIIFENFLEAVLSEFTVAMIVDPVKKVINLDWKGDINTITRHLDLGNKPFTTEKMQINPIIDKVMVHFKEQNVNDSENINAEYTKIWLYEDSAWRLLEVKPESFEGDDIVFDLLPIFDEGTVDLVTESGDDDRPVTSLRINQPGFVENETGQQNDLRHIYIGFYNGKILSNGIEERPAFNTLDGLDLRLDANNGSSIMQRLKNWIAFKDIRSRKQEFTFQQITEVPTEAHKILAKEQSWIWEEMRIIHSEDQPTRIILLLR